MRSRNQAAKEQQRREDRRDRHDRLVTLHGKALSLVMHESRFVLDRTNTFLVTTSFLLAAYGFSLAARNVMSVAIPVVGMLLSAFHPFLIARTIRALEYWRQTAGLIEADPDYWFPGRVDDGARSDVDLDFMLARQRRAEGGAVRQESIGMRLGRPPAFVWKLQGKVPDPNTVFSTWIPLLVGSLWALAMVLALASVTFGQPAGRVTGSGSPSAAQAPAQPTPTPRSAPAPNTPTPTPTGARPGPTP